MKPLLIFAHQAEATTFLKLGQYQQIDHPIAHLYESADTYLLITGEGFEKAATKTAAVLGSFHSKISQVLNFGIAGALKTNLSGIQSIRTVYGHGQKEAYFHSFSSEHDEGLDCISCISRVMDDKLATQLENFASIVDRELWGVARACDILNKPWRAYKLISDQAGSKTNCFEIKDKAQEYSDRLWQFYSELNGASTPVVKSFIISKEFYATLTQKRMLNSLYAKLQKKIGAEKIEELKQAVLELNCEASPKERTNQLISTLEKALNPWRSEKEKELKEILKPFQHGQFRASIPKDWEKCELSLSVKLSHPKHVEDLKKALAEFDYKKLNSFIYGNTEGPHVH